MSTKVKTPTGCLNPFYRRSPPLFHPPSAKYLSQGVHCIQLTTARKSFIIFSSFPTTMFTLPFLSNVHQLKTHLFFILSRLIHAAQKDLTWSISNMKFPNLNFLSKKFLLLFERNHPSLLFFYFPGLIFPHLFSLPMTESVELATAFHNSIKSIVLPTLSTDGYYSNENVHYVDSMELRNTLRLFKSIRTPPQSRKILFISSM